MSLRVLAFDTSGAYCAAALLDGGLVRVTRAEEMARGQAERLMPLLEEVLAEAHATWSDLDLIGVGVGPGNFTGIRISVSAARGLALGLKIPAVGVTTFDALRGGTTGIAAVAGPRETAYLAEDSAPPRIVALDEVPSEAIWPESGADLATRIATVAYDRPASLDMRPAPLYIRPADAAPGRHSAPVILDDA